ncbi:hypothetical protein [Gymnodinialimonas ceratoperidinii]|uniref:Uncharacterized protein n=1 Tax=Gymnodinialimonas ceratoperidinii TaxID=2856823 RepID=A0A8F6TY51_9RHOB|nr:hypothetical protein [Gymnodinialimonas ceratoperidinii]QXT41067.1 hypothetical protein KYE46_07590 [Gymnodinialimonas ceratoperidinii]
MANLFKDLRNAARKRAAYNRTVAEISALPVEFAVEDLGMHPEDAHKIALRSVYGR